MGLKKKEIAAMAPEEQSEKVAELKKTLAKEKGLIASGTRPDNSGKIRDVRRSIARILTIQHLQQKNKANKTEEEPKNGRN